MILIAVIFLLGIGCFLLSLTFRLLRKPMGWLLKLSLHACLGYVFLFIFNFIGAWADLHLALNWVNAAVIGVLGIPGVVLLLLIQYFL